MQPEPGASARARPSARTAAACPGRSRAAACRLRGTRGSARRGRARGGCASPAGTRRRRGGRAPSAAAELVVVARDDARAPTCSNAFSHRAAVAHPVVDHARSTRSRERPLGARARRSRSGRAPPRPAAPARAALNVASITWWALVPASTREVQRQLGVGGQRAEELLGELVVEVADRAGRQRAPRTRSRPRPEMSIAHDARASSIGIVAWP